MTKNFCDRCGEEEENNLEIRHWSQFLFSYDPSVKKYELCDQCLRIVEKALKDSMKMK